MNNEKITNTLGFLNSFKFNFKNNKKIRIDKDLFIIPFNKKREDIKHIIDKQTNKKNIKNINLFGTFILHSLSEERVQKNVWESYFKFYNLSLSIRLLTKKKCNNYISLSYNDSTKPTIFYEISGENYIDTQETDFSYLNNKDLPRLRTIYKAIEYNTSPDNIDPQKYSRLNNALRLYRIAHSEGWQLNKLILFFVSLESLFSDTFDHSDISFKVRLRSAYLLYPKNKNKKERENIFEFIKYGYDIRSKFLHGDNVEKKILEKGMNKYIDLSNYLIELDSIISNIILKILENNNNLAFFSKKQNENIDKIFFDNLVL